MSEESEISTNSYQLANSEFDRVDRGASGGQKLNVSMHGKVKIYTKQEVDEFNEIRGLK